MASSSVSKSSYHARSVSLPSRSHPVASQFDEQLRRLKSSQSATTSSSSSISHRLTGLNGLYSCVDELLQLPLNQQTLSENMQAKWAEVILDGSLRLLDICGTSRDVLLQSKERLQDIQSKMRRRCSGDMDVANEVVNYLNTRKTAKKTIKKCLKNVKEADKHGNAIAIECKLKDVQAITVDIFKSLLSHIGCVKSQSQKCSWFIVSKIIYQSSDKEAAASSSKFDTVDATLDSLICQKKKISVHMSQVEDIRNLMVQLESEIQDIHEVLECLFRHLVKTRATLLNILSS